MLVAITVKVKGRKVRKNTMQGNPKIATFLWFFRCSLIVIPTENASPSLRVPGHVDCVLSVCVSCLVC